ncbi:hypothetical protein Patl1_29402 [Pistacia atlantica]|uniref:Uncharacterized protein n=1 Tax=Pistacia atlantica TaxID=434234 RepID=A0ACC1AD80_9ROSI|nr:hypothetical protein Patl1_29402 [Pistacia atlantica]
MASKQSQPFSVTRQAPKLIVPTSRHRMKNNPSSAMKGKDPVKVIREALSKALVFYYPFAGRLREGDNRKLLVDCNGEGILFVEADANVSLDQLGPEIQPPFICLDELLYVVPGSDGIIGCPLLSIQNVEDSFLHYAGTTLYAMHTV